MFEVVNVVVVYVKVCIQWKVWVYGLILTVVPVINGSMQLKLNQKSVSGYKKDHNAHHCWYHCHHGGWDLMSPCLPIGLVYREGPGEVMVKVIGKWQCPTGKEQLPDCLDDPAVPIWQWTLRNHFVLGLLKGCQWAFAKNLALTFHPKGNT
jgi:hypothetical protein